MYGAGSVGRGFIGPLFANAGYEVVFVDVNRSIVDAFNARHSYEVAVATDLTADLTSVPPAEPARAVPVKGARGIDGANEQAVIDEIVNCDIMATALGAAILQKAAPLIAKGFSERIKRNSRPLDLLICENLKDAAHLLRGWISGTLPEEDKPLLSELGLIETAIGRMIPAAVPNTDDPLCITVEEYGFLPVDKAAFVNKPPEVPGLVPYEPFAFYEERKLYLHNMGHAICAYLGKRKGFKTIAEAIADPAVRLLTQSAMTESAAMLSIKYFVPFNKVFDHAEDLLLRFGNAALGDTCERVGRDVTRKIAAGDRLAGALCQCQEYGVYPVYIALGYAAALRDITDDKTAAEKIARETGGLNDKQTSLVIPLFNRLDSPLNGLIRFAELLKKNLRGNIV